jgi:alpha-ketoglutarate-dependent taurine dioxygenase
MRGLDLRRKLTPDEQNQIYKRLVESKVVAIPEQELTPAQFVQFGCSFGRILIHHLTDELLPGFKEIYVVTNRVHKTGEVGTRPSRGSSYWHIDDAYHAAPQMITILYGVECPQSQGATCFIDMAAAYRDLSSDRRAFVDGLWAEHYVSGGRGRGVPYDPADPAITPEQRTIHPLVRVHPDSGERSLFVSPAHTVRIVGLPLEQSDALLDELLAHTLGRGRSFEYKWHNGDVLMWDNRSVLHRGGGDCKDPRTLYRIGIVGSTPIPTVEAEATATAL